MRYKSCRLLEHGIYFYLDPGTQKLCVGHCCNSDNLDYNDRLYLYFDLKNEILNWDYIFAEKRKLRENAKKGIYPSQCDGCFELTERDWDGADYINHFTAGHIMKCNSRCLYCPTGRIPEWHNKEQDVDIKPIISELLDKNLLRFDGSLRFVGGEPTLMKEFDWLVDLFSKNNVPEIYVPTSAIRLSKSLCKALEKVDSAAIVASIDSGTKKTFENIKGTKFYDIVLKNMKTYLSHARKKDFVILKFILFTNYNDKAEEVENWIKNSKNIGIIEVQFDSEHSVSSSENCENKKYVNRTLKMLKYAELIAEKYNIRINSFLAFMNRAKKIYEKQLEIINSFEYCDIDMNNADLEKIDKLVQEERFSPKRRCSVKISKSIDKETEQKLMTILRLGFDFDIDIENCIEAPILDEIIKTSFSRITYITNKNIFSIFKINRLKSKYKDMIKLGSVNYIEKK